ncbi:MAG TPA: WecB/TagA/CpsF family glycosyltransferase [Candidatus Acidoferrum sp.]|nr:WecB/TagA/CpsF family glycosyltransferase [Candidatus Acidoferrum sp.]
MSEALASLERMIESRCPHFVTTANVDFLTLARADAELRDALLEAHLVIGDGMPVIWASRLLGNPLPERVAGADLVPRLLVRAAQRGYRLFFLGASEEANERAVANARARFPGVSIVGNYSPPLCPLAEMNDHEIIRRVRDANPDVLLVAFGCPKAEKWMARRYRELGVPVLIGVGGTLDFLAGRMRRAPGWMQRSGLEWLFRLGQEPKRLLGRYARDLCCFAPWLARQCWRTGLWAGARRSRAGRWTITGSGAWWHVHAPERLDFAAVASSRSFWHHPGCTHCVMDLGRTRFMDSTGLALLLRLRRQCRLAGGELVLVSPRPFVARLLKAMRLEDCFLTVWGRAAAGRAGDLHAMPTGALP